MPRFMQVHRYIFLALLVGTIALAGVTAPAPTAAAAVGVQAVSYEYTFYSDNTYSVVVGEAYRQCNGTYFMLWGQETSYYRWVREPCGWHN